MRTSFIGTLFAALALPRGLLAAPSPAENQISGAENQALVPRQQSGVVTQQQLNNMKYVVQFAAAAYCNNDISQVGTKVTCSNNACPDVMANDVVNFAHVFTDINAEMDGAIFVDRTNKLIVLAYMGSKSAQSYLLEIDFTVTPVYGLCSGCKVSYGLYSVFGDGKSDIYNGIKAAQQQYPGYNVIATGHSGGGALVSIATSFLRAEQGVTMDLYTFGAPRVGNEAWATFVTNQAPSRGYNYRVTHYNDPVVAIPPSWLDNMSHISPEYWLKDKDADSYNYPLSDVLLCAGVGNQNCRGSTGITLSTKAHSYYFQRVSACYNR